MKNIRKLISKYQGKCFLNRCNGQYIKIIRIVEINNANQLYIKMLVDMAVDGNISKNKYIFATPEWFMLLKKITKSKFLKHMSDV